jgi:hypothetical protein
MMNPNQAQAARVAARKQEARRRWLRGAKAAEERTGVKVYPPPVGVLSTEPGEYPGAMTDPRRAPAPSSFAQQPASSSLQAPLAELDDARAGLEELDERIDAELKRRRSTPRPVPVGE